ncbi:MAG: TetR/AcrR family transcriptional regulator [Stackebrandtia sp.]
MTEPSGAADPARSLALLWGDRERPARRGRHGLSVAKIVSAGLALADASGIEALSMRKVAEALGVGTMSLYTYVPGKAELIEVMIDTVYAAVAAAETDEAGDWRARVESAASDGFGAHMEHRWLLDVPAGRAILGPGACAKYERELSAVDDLGLDDVEMDAVTALVNGHVVASARRAVEAARAEARTGMTERQWWEAHAPALAEVADAARFPIAARVGTAAGRAHDAAYAADGGFAFGLARILDGVAALLDSRR